ncbi:MAG: hypothetical protein BMS9Abin34_093 [Patescibacteria group bacterium]|nr:MAG: hypothetical protein BMS9Abin34_093 [Patescibacteria group bacterium]
MEKKTAYDLIIIGSGPAGMSAAIYAARKGLSALVIGKMVGGQMTKSGEVQNYLGYGYTTGLELAEKFHKHLEDFKGLEHQHGTLVKSLKKKEKGFVAVMEDGERFRGRAVIIASGRIPRHLNVPGEEEFANRGVSYCEVCDAPLFKGKVTTVVGGGNSALEAVLSLAELSPKVYIVNINPQLAGDEVLRKRISEKKNVEVIGNALTVSINGKQVVESLTYKDKTTGKEGTLETEGVFIEIGSVPSVEFDKLTEKDKGGEIKVDNRNQTSVEGIFAAGDVTDIGFYQIIVAAGEGAKAALSAYDYLIRSEKD